MATREPRPTKFRLRWHRDEPEQGVSKWYCTMGGVRVAEAAQTGVPGRDTYPWEWSLTPSGEGLRREPGRSTGTADTLRSCKWQIDPIFRPGGIAATLTDYGRG